MPSEVSFLHSPWEIPLGQALKQSHELNLRAGKLVERPRSSRKEGIPESYLAGQESVLRVSPRLPGLPHTLAKHKGLTKTVLPGQANLRCRVWMGGVGQGPQPG